MASIHRKKGSAFWHCAFYLPDGRRTLRSTGRTDKRKAWAVCQEYEQAALLGREKRFTEARARQAIADIYEIANRDMLPCSTVRAFLDGWTIRKKLEVTGGSHADYVRYASELTTFLGEKADKPIDAITLRDLAGFRDALATRVSGTTVNKILKILRGAWGRAVKDGLIRENVFARLDLVKASKAQRRAFTWLELQNVLAECDTEWRGMVLFGLYTGQRLGDIAMITWRQLDLQNKEWRFTTQKTKRSMAIPLHETLLSYLLSLKAPDDPDAPVFPVAAETASIKTGTLSNRFADILAAAGLVTKKPHRKQGEGRNGQHEANKVSFHCLRHTATSLFKNAGVSDFVTREIVGHESAEVSRVYSHIEIGTLRDAIGKLPDILDNLPARKSKAVE